MKLENGRRVGGAREREEHSLETESSPTECQCVPGDKSGKMTNAKKQSVGGGGGGRLYGIPTHLPPPPPPFWCGLKQLAAVKQCVGEGRKRERRRDLAGTRKRRRGCRRAVPLSFRQKPGGGGGGADGGEQQKQQRHHKRRQACFFSISVAVPAEEEAVGREGAGSTDRRAGDDDGRGRAIAAAGPGGTRGKEWMMKRRERGREQQEEEKEEEKWLLLCYYVVVLLVNGGVGVCPALRGGQKDGLPPPPFGRRVPRRRRPTQSGGGGQGEPGGRGGRLLLAEGRDDAGRGGDEEQQHFGLHKIAAISTTSGSCGEADQSPSPRGPPRCPVSPLRPPGALLWESSCRRQSTRKRQPTAAAPGIDSGGLQLLHRTRGCQLREERSIWPRVESRECGADARRSAGAAPPAKAVAKNSINGSRANDDKAPGGGGEGDSVFSGRSPRMRVLSGQ
ncbi:hypothetical protein niasHT_013750 [Heterodera trifolii]|uniref:Uncharacterized protein n=1 Tax=Heterodera trifolii TaxID=157864 RepID=A0ABD2LC24_9BILA